MSDLLNNVDEQGLAFGYVIASDFAAAIFFDGEGITTRTVPIIPELIQDINRELTAYLPHIFRLSERNDYKVATEEEQLNFMNELRQHIS